MSNRGKDLIPEYNFTNYSDAFVWTDFWLVTNMLLTANLGVSRLSCDECVPADITIASKGKSKTACILLAQNRRKYACRKRVYAHKRRSRGEKCEKIVGTYKKGCIAAVYIIRFACCFCFTLWKTCGRILTLFSDFSCTTYFGFLIIGVLCKTFCKEMVWWRSV